MGVGGAQVEAVEGLGQRQPTHGGGDGAVGFEDDQVVVFVEDGRHGRAPSRCVGNRTVFLGDGFSLGVLRGECKGGWRVILFPD